MSNVATTFRFDPVTRYELERIQQLENLPTLQKTVEHIIGRYASDQDMLKNQWSTINKQRNDIKLLAERLKAIRGAFKVLEYPIPGEEGGEI